MLAGAMALACTGVQAATYSYEFSTEFSGATAPPGPGPWATLSFSDLADNSGVEMTLSLLGSGWNVKGFYFNYDGSATLTGSSFSHIAGDAATAIAIGIDSTHPSFKADGDGFYDIRFDYPDGGGFNAGEQSIYQIDGVSAADFNVESMPGGGNGTWYAALHAQNTQGGASGWLGATPTTPIPEPETYAMLLAGLGLMGFVARRRRKAGIGAV